MIISKDLEEIVLSIFSNNKFDLSRVKSIDKNQTNEIINIFNHGRVEKRLLDFLEKTKIKRLWSDDLLKKLKINHTLRILNNKKIMKDFYDISSALNRENIRFIPLKGIHINLLKQDRFDRNIRDIDILIDKKDIQKALSILLDSGYAHENENNFILGDFSKMSSSLYDIPPLFSNSNTCIEIHYKILNRDDCDLSKQMLLSTNKLDFEDQEICVGDLESLFLHLVYHASSKQGFDVGLQIIEDICTLFDAKDFDLKKAITLSKKLNLSAEVFLFLNLIRKYKIRNIDLKRYLNFENYFNYDIAETFTSLVIYNSATQESIKIFDRNLITLFGNVFSKGSVEYYGFSKKNLSSKIWIIIKKFLRLSRIYLTIFYKLLLYRNFRIQSRESAKILSLMKSINRKLN